MNSRSELIDMFLSANNWHGAKRTMLAGDASFRKYERVFLGNKQAVLMDAPPEKEDITPFIRISDFLEKHQLSSPRILAQDVAQGLLLLEDLGDDLYARVLEKNPAVEEELYLAAADVLIELYNNPQNIAYKGVVPFDKKIMMPAVCLLNEWFVPLVSSKAYAEKISHEYSQIWHDIFVKLPDLKKVLVLRDFHAENLLWLPDRKGSARAGLIDFQDAMLGSPAYDMVSFLEDARRDVSSHIVQKTIDYYLEKTKIPREAFMAAYAIVGAQRNCRIIGTFARLAVRDGKKRYLSFMPRMWKHLENDVKHPILLPLKQWLDTHIKPEWCGEISHE